MRSGVGSLATISRSFATGAAWPRGAIGDQRSTLITATLETSSGYSFTTSTVAEVKGALLTSLSNYGGYAGYTALFDQYRVLRIDAWIFPGVTQATTAAPEVGVLCTTVDIDDSAAPASLATCSMSQGALQTSVLSAHYHSFVPGVDYAAYAGAVFTSYGNTTQPWIDCSSPGVNQYGLKYAASATTTAVTFTCILRATVQFRGIAA